MQGQPACLARGIPDAALWRLYNFGVSVPTPDSGSGCSRELPGGAARWPGTQVALSEDT